MIQAAPSTNPAATLRLLILGVLAQRTMSADELLRIVALAGGGWKPTSDLVCRALNELGDDGSIAFRFDELCVTTKAGQTAGRLVASYQAGVLGAADVIACSAAMPLLHPADHRAACDLLRVHWQTQEDWWKSACRHCPCSVPAIRSLFEHRLAESRTALTHLDHAIAAIPPTESFPANAH